MMEILSFYISIMYLLYLYLEERSHNFKKFSETKIQSRNRSSLIPPFPHHHPTGIQMVSLAIFFVSIPKLCTIYNRDGRTRVATQNIKMMVVAQPLFSLSMHFFHTFLKIISSGTAVFYNQYLISMCICMSEYAYCHTSLLRF